MSESRNEERKSWKKPELRQIPLTDEERSALATSDDPMALLLKMKPELRSKTDK